MSQYFPTPHELYSGNVNDTSGFVLKTHHNTHKSCLEKKIDGADKKVPDTSRLVRKRIIMPTSLRLKVKYLVLLAQLLLLLLMELKIRYLVLVI